MPKKKSKPSHKETIYKQSQSPWEDPDAPVIEPGNPIPRPMTFEEMVYTSKVKEEPRADMDTDLGA